MFNAVLGSLEEKIFFGPNPWRITFKISFVVSFNWQNSRIIFEKLNRNLFYQQFFFVISETEHDCQW